MAKPKNDIFNTQLKIKNKIKKACSPLKKYQGEPKDIRLNPQSTKWYLYTNERPYIYSIEFRWYYNGSLSVYCDNLDSFYREEIFTYEDLKNACNEVRDIIEKYIKDRS